MNKDLLDHEMQQAETIETRYPPEALPLLNENSIYYKGMIGLIFCIVPGAVVGLIFIKMSLDQAKETEKHRADFPEMYTEAAIARVKKGVFMARAGLVLFVCEIVALIACMSLIQ